MQERRTDYVIFQVPGFHDTYPLSINSSSGVTGFCSQATTDYHGFVRDPRGTITLVDPPRSTQSYPRSISEAGDIAGYYVDSSFGLRSFLRSRSGEFTAFDFHGNETVAWSMNDEDTITGYYIEGNLQHGFVWSPEEGITSFDPPESIITFPYSINDRMEIAGTYTDSGGLQHGFVRDRRGRITTFDPSGSIQTVARSINSGGAITGTYTDAAGLQHGFVRDQRGRITTFDPPGSIQTIARSINAGGAVTGDYTTNSMHYGFVRSPDGEITSFIPPGSTEILNEEGINNSDIVIGSFIDSDGLTLGFLREPPDHEERGEGHRE
jgi:uncharacterized membrane protein